MDDLKQNQYNVEASQDISQKVKSWVTNEDQKLASNFELFPNFWQNTNVMEEMKSDLFILFFYYFEIHLTWLKTKQCMSQSYMQSFNLYFYV